MMRAMLTVQQGAGDVFRSLREAVSAAQDGEQLGDGGIDCVN